MQNTKCESAMEFRLNQFDQRILKQLFMVEKGLDVSTLHLRLRFGPSTIAQSVKKLEEKGLLTVTEYIVKLSSNGRKWCVANSSYFSGQSKAWREVPKEMLCDRILPLKARIPDFRELDFVLQKRILENSSEKK